MLEEWTECNQGEEESASKNYAFVEGLGGNNGTGSDGGSIVPDLNVIQERALENVSESMPAPEEQTFVVSLIQREITSDNELTNSM